MKLKDYIKSHTDEVIEIPLKDIIITSRAHLNGKFKPSDKLNEDLIIVVKKMKLKDRYALVVGWHDFIEASSRKLEKIKCIVKTDNRWAFIKRNLRQYANINTIEIPDAWIPVKPKKQKIYSKIKFYNAHGFFKDEIVLDSKGMLMDGYATYIAAKQLNLIQVPIKIC